MILVTGKFLEGYVVQQVAIQKYGEYGLQQVAMTEYVPGHWSVCERRWPY